MPFYILILTNTYSNVKSDTLKIMLSNLIILSDLLHHLVHHFHIKLHYFMIQYTTLPFFKILQNTSKYKGLRSYINLWKSIVRKSINSFLYCSIFYNLRMYGALRPFFYHNPLRDLLNFTISFLKFLFGICQFINLFNFTIVSCLFQFSLKEIVDSNCRITIHVLQLNI